MKIFNTLFTFIFLTVMTTYSFGQEKYTLVLNTGQYVPVENFEDFLRAPGINNSEIVNGNYYRIIQFFEIPTAAEHQLIANKGIELNGYYPKLAYLASIPRSLDTEELKDLNIRAIFPLDLSFKIDARMQLEELPDWSISRDEVKVMIKYHENIPFSDAVKRMEAAGLQIIKSNGINNFIESRVKAENLEEVAKLPFVAHLGFAPEPDIKDDTEGRSLHRSNVLDSGLANGRNYDGTGVNVLVRDDGQIGPHIDFHGRLVQDLADPDSEFNTHGDNVGGIMAGSGNFDPTKRGMAAGAGVFVLDYDPTFLDNTMFYFNNFDVSITNSSYSNGCNAGYTEITETVDQQVYDNPTLMHVFSAGNSNNNDCGYGAGTQWGNITGGHKQAKNVTAVANLFDDASLVNSSSRGPAHDGRIKPDIASNGQDQYGTEPNNTYAEFGGTSGAAPGVAGVFAQLQQAYKSLNGGESSSTALLKGILLNTANDLGNEGPDFSFGWGHINAFRAVKVLEENRFEEREVSQSEDVVVNFEIPEDVTKAKIMLYWDDPEATVGTGFALVNDLDLIIQKDGVDYMPWLLDSSPDPNTLNLSATRGEDHLNNMEQVQIDNPEAGEYTLTVAGTVVPFGAKSFYLVYEYQTEAVDMTYPIGGEKMEAGQLQNIHWDAIGQLEDFQISFSPDNGATWEPIATVAGTERLYAGWVAPIITTGDGKIRIVSSNGNETINEVNFSIAPQTENLEVLSACPEGITLTWTANPEAESFDVYVLGEKFMEVIGNSTENTFLFETSNLEEDQYFSVHTNFSNGATSRRVNAVFFDGGLVNCPQPNDLSSLSTSIDANEIFLTCDGIVDEVFTLEINNNGLMPQSDFSVSYQIDNQPVVTDMVATVVPAGDSYSHNFSQPINITEEGVYNLKSWVTLTDNSYSIDDTISQVINLSIYDGEGALLDYSETFEGASFPPADFLILNPDDGIGWEPLSVVQMDGTEGQVAYFNNYDYVAASNENIEDGLLTTLIDLTDATDEVLSFELAYREFNLGGFNIEDGFRVAVSTDCGNTFDAVLFEEFGDDLATIGSSTTRFIPGDPSVWEKIVLDISDFYGESVIFKFENISGYGNNLFINNINVDFFELVPPVAQFSASSATVCQGGTVTFTNESEEATDYDWSFGNINIPSDANTAGPHTVTFLTAGVNVIQLVTTNSVAADTFEIEVLVESFIVPSFTTDVVDGTLTVGFTNTSNSGSIYEWDFGDGGTSTEENPTYTYASPGTYTVTLVVSSEFCPERTITSEVELISTSTSDLEDTFSIKLSPNPNDGQFLMRVNANVQALFDWKLSGVDGKIYKTGQINTNTNRDIEVTNLATGIFFLELTSGNQRMIERVVIMK